MPEQRQGVERAGDLGPQVVDHLPDTLGQLVDEERHGPVPELLADPPLTVDRTRVSYLTYVWDESKIDRGAGAALDRVEREDEAIIESVQ